MAIDFEIPAEAQAIRERVRQWVHDECIPAEKKLVDGADYKATLAELRKKARDQGLWCPFIPPEYGGMGLGPLANALVQMELGESYLGALSMNTQGPDDATMLTLLQHGTEFQKEKFLKPLLNGDKRICYSMTEKAAGADATGMQTRAVKDGNENYVLKPLYSFAGLGVIIGPTHVDIARVTNPEEYILQHRVDFASLIDTPFGATKAEIRMMYIWLDELRSVTTIIRMGRGKMMGVDHNRDLEWVGASSAFIVDRNFLSS